MNKQYILPVCFAAAAHGALLFGFTKNPRPPKIDEPETRLVVCEFPLEEPIVEVQPDRTDTGPKIPPDAPQPERSIEPPPIEVTTGFTITPPPIAPPGVKDLKVIPEFPPGVPGGDGKGPWSDVLSSIHLDNTPRTRYQPPPVYPFEAKREGLVGEVIVEFLVDERGRVIEPRVVRSSNRVFDEPTLRAVAKWQFEPGRRDGKVVRFRMAAPVVFNLNE
jgi:protein TonB